MIKGDEREEKVGVEIGGGDAEWEWREARKEDTTLFKVDAWMHGAQRRRKEGGNADDGAAEDGWVDGVGRGEVGDGVDWAENKGGASRRRWLAEGGGAM